MTKQGLDKLKELEREMRQLRDETEEVHGQLRDLLWNEDESNQQLDNDNVCPNSKKDEAIRALSEWADEDKDNRSVVLIADYERGTHVYYGGIFDNQVAALQVAMSNNEHIKNLFAKALRRKK